MDPFTLRFTELIRKHERIIFSVCFFYATPAVPFEDLRQEVLISLFRSYPRFRNESRESTWVYRVCLNTCLFSLKRFSPRIETVPLDSVVSLSDEISPADKEKLDWLYERIGRLGPVDKAIVLMWLDDLSYVEIASNLGIPRNTVASKLHRIKKKISSQTDV